MLLLAGPGALEYNQDLLIHQFHGITVENGMQHTTLGESTLQVTRIGLGLAALGRPGYINLGHAEDLAQDFAVEAMEANAHEVLDQAWKLGIRYFDAARSYGRAEAFLASWLRNRNIPTDQVAIGSKWGYTYTADWQVSAEKHEIKEHSRPVLDRQIQESRDLLGAYLDLYQIHSATLDSGVLANNLVLDRLAELRDEGLLIGLSLSGLEQAETLRRAMAIRIGGKPLFGAVQATWNLLERSAGQALQEAHEAGLGVIIKEALANGRLTDRNAEPDFQARKALLEEVATGQKTTLDGLALAAALAQPWVDIVLSGAAQVDHLRSNIAALELIWSNDLDEQLKSVQETPEFYWGRRNQLAWN